MHKIDIANLDQTYIRSRHTLCIHSKLIKTLITQKMYKTVTVQ